MGPSMNCHREPILIVRNKQLSCGKRSSKRNFAMFIWCPTCSDSLAFDHPIFVVSSNLFPRWRPLWKLRVCKYSYIGDDDRRHDMTVGFGALAVISVSVNRSIVFYRRE